MYNDCVYLNDIDHFAGFPIEFGVGGILKGVGGNVVAKVPLPLAWGEGIRGRFFVKILKFKPSEMAFPGILQRSISSQEKFPRTENLPKISLLNILQNFLSAENFPE